jgi:hypothetical protein
MPGVSETIRTFNRFEMKYLLSLKEAEQVKQALRAYMLPYGKALELCNDRRVPEHAGQDARQDRTTPPGRRELRGKR